MKNIILFGLVLQMLLINLTNAQEKELCHKINYGIELDALPYIYSGYYGSVWLKVDNFRIRPVITKLTQPEFVAKDGFKNLNTKAYALIIDYFFSDKEELKGFWAGAGFEYWDNDVTEKISNNKQDYQNYYFTVGGGYVLNIWEGLYLNPWVAVHAKIGGKSELKFEEKNYGISSIVPEASVKLGWRF